MTCEPKCWEPFLCPTCGAPLNPHGRSVAMEAYEAECCRQAKGSPLNKRHLWSIHDSTRIYTDPQGWAAHEAACVECNPDLEVSR